MIREGNILRLQPCFSPVWDTVWTAVALKQAGIESTHPSLVSAAEWLLSKETTVVGDWAIKNPQPEPAGWYFEFRNEWYPDVDDTLMVIRALNMIDVPNRAELARAVERGVNWLLGMQCRDGGWASFDKDNDRYLYTQVPFADHNAMIDPPTTDITGRMLECLAELEYTTDSPVARRAIEFIRRDQCEDGSWFGRWGCNYIYGTWQALVGLAAIGEDLNQSYVQRAVRWLKSIQKEDGGWGETLASYSDSHRKGQGASTASQTAWALLGLIAAGETRSRSVRRGIEWLLERQKQDGSFDEKEWTGTGFPKVFYLRYHYYRAYFPLMAFSAYLAALHAERNPVAMESKETAMDQVS